MDRLTSLAVFARVVETGGFSAAARRLNMSTTMVSNHVQALEDRLGTRLLNRTTRKVNLTEVGRTYYERSRRILADIEEADRLAGALQATPSGQLRLYASITLIRFLSPVMEEFLSSHPLVTIDLTVGENMVDMVEDGYDLIVRVRTPPASSLIVRTLAPWRHIVCCSPAYLVDHPVPRRPQDLAGHNCLQIPFYAFGDEWRFEGPDGKVESVHIRGNFVTTSAEALRLLAVAGSGIVLAPAFLVADDLATGALVPLLPGYRTFEFAINAIYPSRHHLSVKVRLFIDLLAERFSRYTDWNERRDD